MIPTAFIIFGATGNLAQKRIFPALFELSKNNLLPENFKIFACARSQFTNMIFRKILGQTLKTKDQTWQNFAKKIDYLSLDVARDINLNQLNTQIESFEKETAACPQRIFYMAIAPNILEDGIKNLAKNNLHTFCPNHKKVSGLPRIIVEKPFGWDLKSAQSASAKLAQHFSEDQIFRIDHYLGKETVQNIFAFRFGNEIFEPIWNNQFIDHIQITTAEEIGVEKRGEYYDQTGALRDIVQNHLMQLLALTTMDMPEEFNAREIGKKKLEIAKSIKKLSTVEMISSTVRGQYQGYLQEEKIEPNSKTETYAQVKLEIKSSRWQGVPVYLRTGKKLPGKVTSIVIQFKEKGHKLFANFASSSTPNHITLQLQPNEGIGIRLVAKKPGLETAFEPVDMEFCYRTSFKDPQPEAYERLLLDVILGDQSLFISQDFVEESWKIFDPIEEVWQQNLVPLSIYKPGSWGPKEADTQMEKGGRKWLAPYLTICKI